MGNPSDYEKPQRSLPSDLDMIDRNLIEQALDKACASGETAEDEDRFAFIEATLRDALGEYHGVWRWRCPGPNRDRLARKAAKIFGRGKSNGGEAVR
jgi:hypothetical protein